MHVILYKTQKKLARIYDQTLYDLSNWKKLLIRIDKYSNKSRPSVNNYGYGIIVHDKQMQTTTHLNGDNLNETVRNVSTVHAYTTKSAKVSNKWYRKDLCRKENRNVIKIKYLRIKAVSSSARNPNSVK